VIGSTDVPSLRYLEGQGVNVLRPLSETTLAIALLALTDPEENLRMRASIPRSSLPRWSDFAQGLAVSLWLELNGVGAEHLGRPRDSVEIQWEGSGIEKVAGQRIVPLNEVRGMLEGILRDCRGGYVVDTWSFNLDVLNGCSTGSRPGVADVRAWSMTVEHSESGIIDGMMGLGGRGSSDRDDTHVIIAVTPF
jgi:hypothetical protein